MSSRAGSGGLSPGQVRVWHQVRDIHRRFSRTWQPLRMDDDGLTRRESLLRLGGLAAGALGAGALLGGDAGAGDGPQAVAAGSWPACSRRS